MNENMPRTPFSTPLSGSARVTEMRLRNIFSGPKKRPPMLFLALVFAVCIFCGNLVSCNVAETEKPSQPGDVVLDTIKKQLGKRPAMIPLNCEAFEKGLQIGKAQKTG